VRTHGAVTGSALAAGRILRCNPWHPGGVDPVPPRGRRQPECPEQRAGIENAGPSPKAR
jgi:putative component of membrane protein insertase Oxa1/YidC/SpoIIIJ protein YidD